MNINKVFNFCARVHTSAPLLQNIFLRPRTNSPYRSLGTRLMCCCDRIGAISKWPPHSIPGDLALEVNYGICPQQPLLFAIFGVDCSLRKCRASSMSTVINRSSQTDKDQVMKVTSAGRRLDHCAIEARKDTLERSTSDVHQSGNSIYPQSMYTVEK